MLNQQKGGKPVKIALNSNDKVFSEIRDLNFSVIGPSLNKKAKLIEDYYKRRHEAQTVSQIRDFMKGLGSYQAEHQQLRSMLQFLLALSSYHMPVSPHALGGAGGDRDQVARVPQEARGRADDARRR